MGALTSLAIRAIFILASPAFVAKAGDGARSSSVAALDDIGWHPRHLGGASPNVSGAGNISSAGPGQDRNVSHQAPAVPKTPKQVKSDGVAGEQGQHNRESHKDKKGEEEKAHGEKSDGKGDESGKKGEGGEDGQEEEEKRRGEEKEEEEEEEIKDKILEGQDLVLAISLMGFVVFIMTLFYLVNWDDEDMRIYVWTVISTTISIFIAVFSFTSVQQGLVEMFVPKEEKENDSGVIQLLIAAFLVSVYFCCMQFSILYVSGAMEKKPFNDEEPMTEQKERRLIGFKSLSTLFAHMCAFAAINFGGCLQHMTPFDWAPAMRFMVVPILFCVQWASVYGCRLLRVKLIRRIAGQHVNYNQLEESEPTEAVTGIDWCLTMWDEETYEAENEIASVCMSFLVVQACRVSITGVMPNNIGVEVKHYTHPLTACWQLLSVGGFFAVLCVSSVFLGTCLPKTHGEKAAPGSLQASLKRLNDVLGKSFSVAFAWCCLFSGKWLITLYVEAFPPNGVISRVILAIIVSTVAFVVILMLDFLADQESTSDLVDEAIISIIDALALLVGFSWEQTFDGAVEVLAEMCFKGHIVVAELAMAAVVCVIVYPAWRKYILRTLLTLIEHRAAARGHDALEDAILSPT